MKVISFCIYGSKDKYCKGLNENLKLVQSNLPDYNVFIYLGDGVPAQWINTFKSYSFVKIIETGRVGHDNMINRFYAIDESEVEIAIIRDADSRIHDRDIWCIKNFENSSYLFHTIRDHPEHRAFILGGLWGIKKGCVQVKIQDLYNQYNQLGQTINKIQHDQYFLRDVIYPLVCSKTIIYVFNERMRMGLAEHIIKIPLEVTNDDFCGLAITYDDSGNPIKEYKWNYGYECVQCGKFCGPTKCARCGLVVYCSRQCQVSGWVTHKLTCGIDNTQFEQIDRETILVKDQIYSSYEKKFIYPHNFTNISEFVEDYKIDKNLYTNYLKSNIIQINEPTLIVNTLHSCWSHAFIDYVFPFFWSYLYIRKRFNVEKINIFVRKELILKYPENNLTKITTDGKYKKNYQAVLDLIPHNNLYFEHLLPNNQIYKFTNCIHYILDDKWQRSVYNCVDYYFARNYLKSNVIYSDNFISNKLDEFKTHVLKKYQLTKLETNQDKLNLVILDKKVHPDNTAILLQIPYLNNIIELIDKSKINFNGVKYFEDLELNEQIQIILDNDIIISPHGGALLHMIFGKNKQYIEFFNNIKTTTMYQRVSSLTNNKLIQININTPKSEILKLISNLLKI